MRRGIGWPAASTHISLTIWRWQEAIPLDKGLNMTRNSFFAAMAVLVIAGTPFVMAGAHGLSADDETAVTSLTDAATEAGTAAGVVNQCRSDATPIKSAFMHALDEAKVGAAQRQSLWERYRSAEASTLTALASEGAVHCADTNAIIQDTIHRLEMPLSQS